MTCKEADIVTTSLLAGDDELSKEFVDLVNSKNEFLKRRALLEADERTTGLKFGEQKHAMRLKAQSADMKIRQIVNYKILSGDAQAQAYEKLAKEMINSGENAGATIQLLRMVDDASPKDFEEVAHILFEEGEDITSAMTRIRDNIANAGSTLYEQEKVFQSNLVKQLKKEGKSRGEIAKAVKAAMGDDDELIKKGLTPNNFSKPDDEWTVIKNTFESPEDQMKAWKQYCLGKAIIGGIDGKVLKALNVESSLKNFVGEITAEQIDNINTLEELISRAYTNTKQLVEDGLLRDAFNNKLTQLLSNKKITTKQLDYAKGLIRAVRFAKEGAGFSKIVLYDAVGNQARKMGYEVANSEKFYDNILKTIRDEDFIKKIDDKGMVTMADGSKIAANDLLELIVLATGDRRIPKLLREGAFSNTSILDIATQVALGNSENATKKILQLINKVKEMPNLGDSKELALITLCGRKIQPGAKKGFFDYRKMYQNPGINKETRLKADFEEKMANANRAEIAVDGLEDLTDKKDIVKILQDNYAGGYIITNDAGWRNNKEFANALDAANAALGEDKQITVLYPRQAQMSNFTMEGGKLIFRSRDSNGFRQIMDKVSLRTLGDAEATKELKDIAREVSNGSAKAVAEYNKELEESANKYFAAMLGKNEWANPNYRDTLHGILEDLTGIPIKSLRDLNSVDKNKLWQAVNTEFTNAQRTTGIFRNEITDITDTINRIEDMNLNDMVSELDGRLGGLIDRTAITEDKLPLFKQALEDLETASSPEAWMEAKGRLLSMANGGNEETFTLSQLRNIFTNGTQATEYKQMFFPNQNLTEEQTKKYVASINNMIFDGLTIALNNNLVKMGYALPLDSARGIVLGYLTNTLSLSDSFAKAFLYKNGLPDSLSVLESIVRSAMPNDLKLGYEEALYKLRDSKPTGEINRIIVQPNPFLPDTYSSIASIVNAKTGNIGVNSESKYLSNILDKYISEVEKGVKEGMTFEKAQQLKTQVGYALDIFEQDIVMSKYGKFLTPEQKSSIRNLKSYLPIVVGKEGDVDMGKQLQALRDVCNEVSSSFSKNIEDVVGKYTTLKQTLAKGDSKAIEQLNEKLKEDGTVMANVDGEVVIVDARTNIKNLLNDMPQSVKGLGGLGGITDEILDGMDNRSIYFLNTLLESIKKLDALSKWEPAIMYHIDPELNMVRFFDTYRLVDNGIGERIPYALVGNVLEGNSDLAKLNLSGLDSILKTDIFKKVKSKFQVDGTIDMDGLEELINSSIDSNSDKVLEALRSGGVKDIEKYKQLIFNEYQKIFTPYTHLKDIPSGGAEFGLQGTKEKINEILAGEIGKVREALEGLPDRYGQTLNNISVESPTGEVISLQQFLDGQSPSWKKAIFDDENILVKSQDDLLKEIATSTDDKEIKKVEAANRKYKREAVNQYNEVLQTIMNQGTLVSEAERKLTSRMLNNARSTAMKYTLTKKLVDASNMVGGLEEEAARMVKYWLVGFGANMTFGKFFTKDVLKRLKDTQDAYRKFYTQSLEDINNIVPKNEAEELAVHLCKYFKTIENFLGSADGLTGVTTDAAVNKAFYNIGETFLNIDTVKGVFALMSAIEENQLLKFFKFSKPRQASYVQAFTRPATLATEDMVGGYREYITKMPDNIDRDTFNRLFASNFTETEFKTLYQALAGVTYVGGWGKVFNQLLNLANGTSFLGRFLVSYPGQLLTVPQQGIGYFIKMRGYENAEGITDYQTIDRVRSKYGTLDKAYNEINAFNGLSPDDINTNSYYNRYGVPDIDDVYKKAGILTTDDVNDIYAKIGNYQSTRDNTGKLMRSMDAYKDNANNLIDGTFARNFKNIAFLKAIRENAFMQFGTVEAFEEFMTNNQVSKQVKQQLMDAVNAAAGRTFRNILGLGFGGLDRAIGGYGISNIFYGLMQFLNFRGAWGQNIFRQTGETFISAIKMAKMGFSKEGRDNIALYLSRNPEFINFTQTLFNDMLWSFKMLRYQDNGRWSELEDENDALDYLGYTMELLPMASQWFQGIQSFGPLRPFYEQGVSIARSLENPEVYRDTYGLGAFFNALGKNAGRNWKPRNWVFQAIQALEEGGESGFMSFVQNEFWKLSFGSLRYMMDDEASKYGYTYDLLSDDGGIPSFFRGEAEIDSDKSFSFIISNNNTWDAMMQFFNYDNTWEDRKTYLGDWRGAVINGSNLWGTTKNLIKAVPGYGTWYDSFLGKRINPFTMDSFTDVIEGTSAGKELLRTGKVTPKTALEMKSFVEEYVDAGETNTNRSNLKPYGSNFAKAINNYNQFGHVNGIEPHSEDEELEFMLEQIRYERLENGNFKEVNGKRQETQFWKDMVQYIHDHPTDMETTSRLISKDVFDWIELNNDNPNYLLFQSLVGQGMVDWYLDDAWVRFQDDWNAAHGVTKKSKADEKLSKKEGIDSGLYWGDFMEYLLNTNVVGTDKPLVEYLQDLDRRNTMSASIKIIKNQMQNENDKKVLEKFVKFNVDSYGNEYVTIDSQYASQLRSMGGIGDAIEKGDVNLLMARASQFANQYMNPEDDPTGLVTAYTVNSLVQRVRDAQISPDLKIKMIAALSEKNIEFMQKNLPALREAMGDELADAVTRLGNQLLFEEDGAVQAAIGDALANGDGDAAKAGGKVSNKIKNCMSDYTSPNDSYGASGSGYGGRSSDTIAKWVPFTVDVAKLLDATGGKGYSPKNPDINVKTYNPKIDLSIGKDINRKKKVFNTQEVKKKKVVL